MTTPSRTPEKAILRYLKSLPNSFAWKSQAGPYQRAGLPDVMAVIGGRFYAFEVKRPGGRLTALQASTLAEMQKAGTIVAVVTSVEEAKRIIEGGC